MQLSVNPKFSSCTIILSITKHNKPFLLNRHQTSWVRRNKVQGMELFSIELHVQGNKFLRAVERKMRTVCQNQSI